MKRVLGVLAAAALVASAVASCGGDGGGEEPRREKASIGPLTDKCPKTVVVQTSWLPQAEYGGLYGLLGDPDIDTGKKSVSGPLLDGGKDTGVRLEIRSGGPANNYTPPLKMMYAKNDIMFGSADIDQVARVSGTQPVQAVFAPMDKSPLLLMWDPKTYPGFKSVKDIGRSKATVLYFPGSTYMDYLIGAGLLKKQQVDASYDGSPSRFVAEQGKVVQQGFLTNEIFQYEKELPQWKRPVRYALVADAGYPLYPETLTVRKDRMKQHAACLEGLVPVLQRGTKAYAADPGPANRLMVDLVKRFKGFPYSPARADNATKEMLAKGVLGNGDNKSVGDLEEQRVQRIVDIVRPIFARQKSPLPDGLTAKDLYTNEFIDPTIGLEK